MISPDADHSQMHATASEVASALFASSVIAIHETNKTAPVQLRLPVVASVNLWRGSDTVYELSYDGKIQSNTEFEVNTTHVSPADTLVSSQKNISGKDPWLENVVRKIAEFRDVGDGWDSGEARAPSWQSLNTAELLARQFMKMMVADRPLFSVDVDGQPSFAAYNSKLYLHLTISQDSKMSWYAVIDGAEDFEEDIIFDGSEAPAELDKILL